MAEMAAARRYEEKLERFLLNAEIDAYLRQVSGYLDNLDLKSFVNEFTNEGTYKLIPRENYENDLIVCIIDDNKKRLKYRQHLIERHWHYEKFHELRMLSPLSVTPIAADRVRAITNFVVYRSDDEGTTRFHLGGVFEDELVQSKGRWRILNRLAILDTYLPREAIVVPP